MATEIDVELIGRQGRQRAAELYSRGLIAVPCWAQGLAFPKRDHRALADNPPSLAEIQAADYRGGLAILLGTAHPAGGYVIALDIDRGPEEWPAWPLDTLMAEAGTAPGKWHILLRVKDRLEGTIYLEAEDGSVVAEVKGYGVTALRSWPTQPPDKPLGYSKMFLADEGIDGEPTNNSRSLTNE